jgi:hypothetical protein
MLLQFFSGTSSTASFRLSTAASNNNSSTAGAGSDNSSSFNQLKNGSSSSSTSLQRPFNTPQRKQRPKSSGNTAEIKKEL